MLPEAELEPVTDVPDARRAARRRRAARPGGRDQAQRRARHVDGDAAGQVAAEVKDGLAFLDVIVRQVLALREESGARLPLVLMNSFYTRDDSLAAARALPRAGRRRPVRLRPAQGAQAARRRARRPPSGPPTPRSSGARPGHGDLYPALLTSGMLGTLLERGYRYAFISNSDNLGAVLDPRILAWFAGEELPVRGGGHRPHPRPTCKGGHLAPLEGDGRLILRETAQTPGRGHGRLHRPRPPPLLPHQQPVARPARAVARCWRRATACSGCR